MRHHLGLETELEATTGWLDTHPATRDRLASVAREAEPGMFTLDAPASALFGDLEGLRRAATLAEYRDMIGSSIDGAAILPVTALLDEAEGDREEVERLARFNHGCSRAACRVRLIASEIAASDEPDADTC
jgi:hypothetical protein